MQILRRGPMGRYSETWGFECVSYRPSSYLFLGKIAPGLSTEAMLYLDSCNAADTLYSKCSSTETDFRTEI